MIQSRYDNRHFGFSGLSIQQNPFNPKAQAGIAPSQITFICDSASECTLYCIDSEAKKMFLLSDCGYICMDSISKKTNRMKKGNQILSQLFQSQITVLSISEPVVRQTMAKYEAYANEYNFDSVLIEEKGALFVYDKGQSEVRPVREAEIISESTPIADVFGLLLEHKRLFVMEKTKLNSIVTISDLDKIPIRIWLFGLVSLAEFYIKKLILTEKIPWVQCLSEERLKAARKLFDDKQKRNEEIDLLHCVQLSDLIDIIRKHDVLLQILGLEKQGKNQMRKLFKDTNKLRDALAHSQESLPPWETIFEITQFLQRMLDALDEEKELLHE